MFKNSSTAERQDPAAVFSAGGDEHGKDTHTCAHEQVRAAESQSVVHLHLARLRRGLISARALAVAAHSRRCASLLMGAAHGR
jgi:hypothetical protein